MERIMVALLSSGPGEWMAAAWRGEEAAGPSWARRHPVAVTLAAALLAGALNAALGTH